MSPPASSVKHWVPILGGCGNVRRWGKTLRICSRRWDVAPSPCLFPVHHKENPSSFLFTMKRTLPVSCSPWREPGSFLFTMKRTLQASCSQQRQLWMHLSITMMLSFQVLWMNKTRNSDQKHPSSLMLSCRVLLSLNEKVWLIRFFTHLSLHLLWASPLGVVNLFNFPL